MAEVLSIVFSLNLLLAVRIDRDKLLVEHTGEGGFRKEIGGVQGPSLDSLQSVELLVA